MKTAQDQRTRAIEQLRGGVEAAITALGTGFLRSTSPRNRALREKLQAGTLSAQEFYRQLQRVVYRLIFLLTAEERGLLLDPKADPSTSSGQAARDRYTRYYSVGRLRRRRRPISHAPQPISSALPIKSVTSSPAVGVARKSRSVMAVGVRFASAHGEKAAIPLFSTQLAVMSSLSLP